MKLLQILRDRKSTKVQDATTRYWDAITKSASKEVSDRVLGVLADSLENVMHEIEKTDDDLEDDLELVVQLAALQDAPAQLDTARAEAQGLFAETERLNLRANELHAEFLRVREEAENTHTRAKDVTQAAETRMAEYRRLGMQLTAARHPGFVAASAAATKEREIEKLRGELRSLDRGVFYGARDVAARIANSPKVRAEHRNGIIAKLRALGADVTEFEVATRN